MVELGGIMKELDIAGNSVVGNCRPSWLSEGQASASCSGPFGASQALSYPSRKFDELTKKLGDTNDFGLTTSPRRALTSGE